MTDHLIGIGKSTLAVSLAAAFDRWPDVHEVMVRQDDFYKRHGIHLIPEVDGVEVWDCPDALKLPEFIKYLRGVKSHVEENCLRCQEAQGAGTMPGEGNPDTTHVVIIEGFMLYCEEEIYSQFDISVLLDLSFEESKRRREDRTDRRDVKGLCLSVFTFMAIISHVPMLSAITLLGAAAAAAAASPLLFRPQQILPSTLRDSRGPTFSSTTGWISPSWFMLTGA